MLVEQVADSRDDLQQEVVRDVRMSRLEGGQVLLAFLALPGDPTGQQVVFGDLLSQTIGSVLAIAAFQILEDEKKELFAERCILHRGGTLLRTGPVEQTHH